MENFQISCLEFEIYSESKKKSKNNSFIKWLNSLFRYFRVLLSLKLL